MDKRKILIMLVVTTAIAGVVLVAVPFISSMNPGARAKENAKTTINISSIPKTGPLEIDYHGYKVFVLREPKLAAYSFPFWDGAYRLPDPTWERAFIPCKTFEISNKGFFCTDIELDKSWRENARWNSEGKTTSKWMPDLKTVSFIVQGEHIIFSPEYK